MKPVIGAQLWSLRNLLWEQPEATLKKLAASGYKIVEPAGFDIARVTIQGFEPQTLKSLLNEQGLEMISGHFQVSAQEAFKACECAASLEMKYIVRSFFSNEIEQSIDAYKRAAETLNQIGTTAKSFGLKLAYHNHAHEFETINGILLFDILLKYTDPNLVFFEPDLGWMGLAKQNIAVFFYKYPDRFPLWHLRDIDGTTKKSTTIGQGIINLKSSFAHQKLAGAAYLMVEMASDVENPLEKILDSYAIVKSWL